MSNALLLDLVPQRLVFIDETWASTNMGAAMADERGAGGPRPECRTAIARPQHSFAR